MLERGKTPFLLCWFLLTATAGLLAQQVVPRAADPYAEFDDEAWRSWNEQRAHGSAAGWPPPWLDRIVNAVGEWQQRGLITADNQIPDSAAAKALTDELFRDWGDPWANAHWQNAILTITKTSRFATAEARATFADGLLDYYHGGGGFSSAANLLDFSAALNNVNEPKNDEIEALSEELLNEAMVWSAQVGNTSVLTSAQKEVQRRYHRQEPEAADNAAPVNHSTERVPARAEHAPETPAATELSDFTRALREFGTARVPTPAEVRAVGDRARTFLASRRIAERERHAAIAKYLHTLAVFARRFKESKPELIKAIDEQLVEFPGVETLRESSQLRAAWARCVSTIGHRSTESLHLRCQALMDTANSARQRSVFRAAFEATKRSP